MVVAPVSEVKGVCYELIRLPRRRPDFGADRASNSCSESCPLLAGSSSLSLGAPELKFEGRGVTIVSDGTGKNWGLGQSSLC